MSRRDDQEREQRGREREREREKGERGKQREMPFIISISHLRAPITPRSLYRESRTRIDRELPSLFHVMVIAVAYQGVEL